MEMRGIVKSIRVNKIVVFECIVNFFAARGSFMSINPVAVALYILAVTNKRNKNPVIYFIIAGVLSCGLVPQMNFGFVEAVKYLLIFCCISVVDKMTVRRKMYLSREKMACLGGLVTFLMGFSGGILNVYKGFAMSFAEGVLAAVLVFLLYKAENVIHFGIPAYRLQTEQVISLVMLTTFVVLGFFEPWQEYFSAARCIMYVMVLYMAYFHGEAAGAIAGCGAGVYIGCMTGNVSFVGLCCLVGTAVGMIRECGKLLSAIMFAVAGAGLALVFPEELFNINEFKPYMVAILCFLALPSQVFAVENNRDDQDDALVRQNIMTQTSIRLKDFSDAFEKIGTLYEREFNADVFNGAITEQGIINELAKGVCTDCSKCSTCFDKEYYETYRDVSAMFSNLGNESKIRAAAIPPEFAGKCIRLNDFMNEANHQLELARLTRGWLNRFAWNRGLIARQMGDVSRLMRNLEFEISDIRRVSDHNEKELYSMISSFGVEIKKLGFIEKKGDRLVLCITMKSKKNDCITFREISNIISDVMGERWCVAEEYGYALPAKYTAVNFVKDVKFTVLTGVAKKTKNFEQVSGDSYSFITLPGGKVILTITDGMGSGKNACAESETAIELLEELIGAGFGEELALRLVNSCLLYSEKSDDFVTVDLAVIDLNSGKCNCIKYGAPPTFIRGKDGISVIESSTMPIGLMPDIAPDEKMCRLSNGDYIIMMSDGITDNYLGDSGKKRLEGIIENIGTDNPQEMAERILAEALLLNNHQAKDDMSVLVAGMWTKR